MLGGSRITTSRAVQLLWSLHWMLWVIYQGLAIWAGHPMWAMKLFKLRSLIIFSPDLWIPVHMWSNTTMTQRHHLLCSSLLFWSSAVQFLAALFGIPLLIMCSRMCLQKESWDNCCVHLHLFPLMNHVLKSLLMSENKWIIYIV